MSLFGRSSTSFSNLVIVGIIVIAVFYVIKNRNNPDSPIQKIRDIEKKIPQKPAPSSGDDTFLPTSTTGEIVHHSYYSLSYSEQDEQAEWVAYELTREMLSGFRNERKNNFRPDRDVPTGSATPDDYRGSGYDRGHLCPASDMSFDETAMDETFFMSNMSPQKHYQNCGIWRELEECVKDWAKKYGKIYVVTGPILKGGGFQKIGRTNKVSVPEAYYKVVMTADAPRKAIGFIVPNEASSEPLNKFSTSIDAVETATDIDFFYNLLSKSDEIRLEANTNLDGWQLNDKRYQTRVTKWNQN